MYARVLNAILVLLATAAALAVPAPITTPGTITDTGALNASTRVLATRISAPATSTSAQTTGTSAPSTSSNALLPSSTIPPGYTYYPATRSSYKLHKSAVSWHVANTTCAREGADLLVLNDAEEADIVAPIVRVAVGGGYYTWTGLRDNRTGGVMEWRTVHGEPLSDVYNVWSYGEPQNKPHLTCAVFDADTVGLRYWFCDETWYFICEISQ